MDMDYRIELKKYLDTQGGPSVTVKSTYSLSLSLKDWKLSLSLSLSLSLRIQRAFVPEIRIESAIFRTAPRESLVSLFQSVSSPRI
jgi:hypothetical protein